MGKGTYRVTQSNLRLGTCGMTSALEGGLFVGHKNNIFSKQYLDAM